MVPVRGIKVVGALPEEKAQGEAKNHSPGLSNSVSPLAEPEVFPEDKFPASFVSEARLISFL